MVVVAFAGLAASFTAKNSTWWMHLATGRLLAEGQFQFGVDPFASRQGVYWSNYSWATDFGSYLAFRALAGADWWPSRLSSLP